MSRGEHVSLAMGKKLSVTDYLAVGPSVGFVSTARIDLFIFEVGGCVQGRGEALVNVKGTSAAILDQMFTQSHWVSGRRVC